LLAEEYELERLVSFSRRVKLNTIGKKCVIVDYYCIASLGIAFSIASN
jgi:hypothetical protein